MSESPDSNPAVMRWVLQGLAALLTTAVLIPVLTPTAPVVYFDMDPRYVAVGGGLTVTAWGPGPTSVLQGLIVLLSMGSAGLALAMGARLSRWVGVLTLMGIAAAAWHMVAPSATWEDGLHGGAWISAACAGFAASLLGQFPGARRWVVGLSLAAIVPVAMTACWYVWVEHPFSVEQFEANRDAVFAAQGIEQGTEQAELYERRLRFADATGAIGLSNVLGSIAAAVGVMAAGVAVGVGRRWRGGGQAAVMCVAVAAAGAAGLTVLLTGSTGAVVGGALGVGVLGVAALRRWLPGAGFVLPVVAVGVVMLAFGAVIVRGSMGAPEPPAPGQVVQGERSLLFRYQYWSAAARIAMEHPVLGSGVGGFADGYLRAKDPLNPETVTSAHNVLVDYITMLGVGGLAWSVLLGVWLWASARGCAVTAPEPDEPSGPESFGRPGAMLLTLSMAVLFGIALVVQQASLYLDTAVLWLAAIALFAGVAVLLIRGMSGRATRLALLVAAVVLLAHNQIEMGFFQPASTGLMWLLVGAAGAGRDVSMQTAALRVKRVVPTLVTGAIVLVFMLIHSVQTHRHEHWMREATVALLRNDTEEAWRRLEAARSSVDRLDGRALRWQVRLYVLEPMLFAPNTEVREQVQPRIDRAITWIEAEKAKPSADTSVYRIEATLLETASRIYGDSGYADRAVKAYETLLERTPYNINDTLALGDLYAELGDRGRAQASYHRVLALRDAKYLDPADPLPGQTLERIRAYLEASPAGMREGG